MHTQKQYKNSQTRKKKSQSDYESESDQESIIFTTQAQSSTLSSSSSGGFVSVPTVTTRAKAKLQLTQNDTISTQSETESITPIRYVVDDTSSNTSSSNESFKTIQDYNFSDNTTSHSSQSQEIESLKKENKLLRDMVSQLNLQMNQLMSQVAQLTAVMNQTTVTPNINLNNSSVSFPNTNHLTSSSNPDEEFPPLPIRPTSNTSNSQSWAAIATLPNASQVAQQRAKDNLQRPERREGFQELKKLIKPPTRQIKKANTSTTSSAVYVAGFEFVRNKVIWENLRKARFQTSRIINMQWIGKSIIEFIVNDSYKIQFQAEIKELNARIVNFNPSNNVRATTTEQRTQTKQNFVIRCLRNIFQSTNPAVQTYFQKLLNCAGSQDEETQKIIEQETEKAKAAQDLINATQISSNPTTPSSLIASSSTNNSTQAETTSVFANATTPSTLEEGSSDC